MPINTLALPGMILQGRITIEGQCIEKQTRVEQKQKRAADNDQAEEQKAGVSIPCSTWLNNSGHSYYEKLERAAAPSHRAKKSGKQSVRR